MIQSICASRDDRLGQAANEYFEAVARGETPSIEEFACRFPDIGDDIRRVFPALAVVGDSNSTAAKPEQVSHPPVRLALGDFRIIRELGRGGMGTVYEAEQLSMGRHVALKVLPFAALVHENSLQRFRNEVRAAAALNHPHIVPVYSIGEERGVHFYAMQLIRGKTLADLIEERRAASKTASPRHGESQATCPLPKGEGSHTTVSEQARISTAVDSRRDAESYRTAAKLGIQAAEALQHAHEQGVLHRDIKPSNLLLDSGGKLYVTDFGLARIEADAGMTMTGDIVGTLRYMAPEQALAKRVVIDHRADIYSLGATLYELLTLQPAFGETDRSDLLKQIAFEEPRALRKIDRRIPGELETIVLKAMAKQPFERYHSAQSLADDLLAFLESRPIKAKRPSFSDRLWKWSQRHRSIVRTAGLALVILTVILAFSTARINRALNETSDLLYMADMSLAYQIWEKGWSDEVQTILDRQRPTGRASDHRGLEWHLLQKSVQQPNSIVFAGHEGPVNELAVFPNRPWLASVGQDGTLRIWDVCDRSLLRTIKVCEGALNSVSISPNGRFVAIGSTVVYLCDVDNGDQISKLFQSEYNVESLAFTPDGKSLVAGIRYDEVCLISLDGQVIKRIPCTSRVESLEYISGSPLLLIPNRHRVSDKDQLGILELWREGLSGVEQELDGSRGDMSGQISVARSSPCGKFVAAGARDRKRAYLFNWNSGRLATETPVSRDRLTDVAYATDGKTIAIGYANGCIEHFELQFDDPENPSIIGQPRVINAHIGEVKSMKFVNASTLATSGSDGRIRIWDLRENAALDFQPPNSRMNAMKLSADGSLLLYVCDNEFLIANTNTGKIVFRRNDPDADFGEAAWSPTGNKLAIGSLNSASVSILEQNGKSVCSISHGSKPSGIAFSPSHSIVAIIGNDQLQLCNSESGRESFRTSLAWQGSAIAFSRDGARLAYGGKTGELCIFDVAELRCLHSWPTGSHVHSMAFSPDDSLLATGHGDSIIRIWEVETGHLRSELVGHASAVRDVAFSLDGHTLVSASNDGAIRLWSLDHSRSYGVLHQRLTGSNNAECRLSLSPNGLSLAVGYRTLGHRTEKDDVPAVLFWKLGDPSEN